MTPRPTLNRSAGLTPCVTRRVNKDSPRFSVSATSDSTSIGQTWKPIHLFTLGEATARATLASHNHGLSRNCTLYQTNLYQLHHQIYSTGTGSALKNLTPCAYNTEVKLVATDPSFQPSVRGWQLTLVTNEDRLLTSPCNWDLQDVCSGFFLSQTVEVTRFTA